ncbi:FKBP-type peptidyl-prolyl cis-trans isomerase [Candidatus Nitrospira bockiana]
MGHRTVLSILATATVFAASALSAGGQSEGISQGDKVTIAFTLSVPESHFVMRDNVSEYVPGQHQLVPGLERALMGMKPGEEKRVELGPEDGFGRYDEQKKMSVSREELPQDAKVGDVYQTAHGQPFMVQDISDRTAVVDFNHPLAGKHLVFDVRVLKVDRPEGHAMQPAASSAAQDPTIVTLTGATIEQVDQESHQLRVRTQEGENWSLRVTRDDLLQGLQAGDRVSLELNSDSRVKNVIKAAGP